MIGDRRILPRAPLIRPRHFGLTDPSWPAARKGRADGSSAPRVGAADRHFRTLPGMAAPALSSPAPIHLAVNQLTLSPRFRMLWQTWQAAGSRIERLERAVTRASLRETSVRSERTETLIERAVRNLASRLPGQGTPPIAQPHQAPRPVFPPRTGARSVSRTLHPPRRFTRSETHEHRVARHSALTVSDRTRRAFERLETHEHRVARHSALAVSARAQRAFERIETQVSRVLKTRIAQHRLTYLDTASPRRPAADAQAMAPKDTRIFAAAAWPQAARGLPAPAPHTQSAQRPAERTFRAEKPAAAPLPPTPAPRPQPAPQQAPQMDIAKLDTVLWQRFEKRLRIEQERRGRA